MASHLADAGKVGTKAISSLLRHKNLRTTEIYLHSIDGSDRSAVESIEGKFAPKIENSHPQPTPTKEKEATGLQ